MYKSFKDLAIWQEGMALLKEVYKLSNYFPKEEKLGLARDLRRTANSVIANIAESHGRYFFADKVRVLYIARGEINEMMSHLFVAQELNYLTKEIVESLEIRYELLMKGLNLHLNSLKREKSNQKVIH